MNIMETFVVGLELKQVTMGCLAFSDFPSSCDWREIVRRIVAIV